MPSPDADPSTGPGTGTGTGPGPGTGTGTATDPSPQAAELLRRLRAWSVSSWKHGNRVAITRSVLQELADRASVADGRSRPEVPDAGLHALADQVQVLSADAIRAGVDRAEVTGLLTDLGRRLGLPIR